MPSFFILNSLSPTERFVKSLMFPLPLSRFGQLKKKNRNPTFLEYDPREEMDNMCFDHTTLK